MADYFILNKRTWVNDTCDLINPPAIERRYIEKLLSEYFDCAEKEHLETEDNDYLVCKIAGSFFGTIIIGLGAHFGAVSAIQYIPWFLRNLMVLIVGSVLGEVGAESCRKRNLFELSSKCRAAPITILETSFALEDGLDDDDDEDRDADINYLNKKRILETNHKQLVNNSWLTRGKNISIKALGFAGSFFAFKNPGLTVAGVVMSGAVHDVWRATTAPSSQPIMRNS